MGTITALVESLPGPAFDAFRYPHAYAQDLLRERELLPQDLLHAAEQETVPNCAPARNGDPSGVPST
ncbi:hypothetical protein [Kitasatospora sp. NPDC093679]|uniref:hypothetical protein n=1 Tax=Kitasatospora sp. NPDC093679 TaxID=3154983 RepID=UPI003421C16A